ncbi:MAG TPA: ABC transporter ATP-binding protein [Streptosporangiales bacterium]
MSERTNGEPVLDIAGLSVSFEVDNPAGRGAAARRTVVAVDDVSLTLHHAQVLALVGESGSGKSVTAMSTLGLLPATARVRGDIRLGGTQLVGADDETLREVRGGRIGTIFQEPMSAFNPLFTVGNQIAEALWAHGRAGPDVRGKVFDLLRQVGLDDAARVWSAYPHQLSGGQLQRAMIAMAISCDPVALIADEPTTALDVTVQAGILDLLRDLRDRLGTAILLITHDMGVVADLADDVVVLRDGKVVERAPVTELFAQPRTDYTRTLLDAVPRLSGLRLVADRDPTPRHDVLPGTPDATSLRHAVVEYPARRRRPPVRAVDDVELTIPPGRVVGLVGESGSGKSTIGRALAGLVRLTSGGLVVAGTDMTAASTRRWRAVRKQLGIVFQDPASSLNPRHTIETSVGEPLYVHTPLRGAELSARVRALLGAVQLRADMATRYPHEMSGGQRQRAAIARAIALDPVLLVADEPTSALDVSVQDRVLDMFAELQQRLGFGCLFISHDLAVVERLAHHVAVMHDGRIVEQGATADVLREPREPYTQRLLAAAPVADPIAQCERREAWRRLATAAR